MIQDLVIKAQELATRAHHGQTDKAGIAYITHPARIVGRLWVDNASDEALAVGWLHDVVEDTEVTLTDLAANGFPETVIDAVDAITHREHESNEAYYTRVKANPIALQVKLADIADNLEPARVATLDPETRERLNKKYTRALRTLTGEDQ